jgi:hypothetical protein
MARHSIKGTDLFWSDTDGDSKPDTKQTVYSDPLKGHPVFSTAVEVKDKTFNPSTGKLEKK